MEASTRKNHSLLAHLPVRNEKKSDGKTMFKIYSSRNEYIPSRKHESNVQENEKMELNFMFIFQDHLRSIVGVDSGWEVGKF